MRESSSAWWWGAVLFLWMGIIFLFSHQPGSGKDWEPPLWYVLERKSAHIIEYAILMALALRWFSLLYPQESWKRVGLASFLLAVTYGFLDEIHQSFIFGRGARLSDVLIDAGGAFLIGLLYITWKRKQKTV